MMRHCLTFLGWLTGLSCLSPACADTLRVGGPGFAMPLVEKLAEAYQRSHPEDTVQLVLPPLGSGGGLRALATGRIDLAFAGRDLKPEEQATLGTAVEWVRTPLALVTNGGQRTQGFSPAELADVYAGRQTRWDDGSPVRLILRSAYETDTQLLRSLSPLMDQALDQAFLRKGMVVAENDLDTLALLEKTPGSLGPVTLGLLRLRDSRLTLLPLAGVAPSVDAYRSGQYRLGKSLYIVSGKAPSEVSRRFVAFLRSSRSQAVLQSYAFVPAP